MTHLVRTRQRQVRQEVQSFLNKLRELCMDRHDAVDNSDLRQQGVPAKRGVRTHYPFPRETTTNMQAPVSLAVCLAGRHLVRSILCQERQKGQPVLHHGHYPLVGRQKSTHKTHLRHKVHLPCQKRTKY